MSTYYTYSIHDDIVRHEVNINQLQNEIQISNYSRTLEGITTNDDEMIITFDGVLLVSETNALNTLVRNHDAITDEVFRKLYRPKDTYLISPSGGDFETIREAVETVSPGSLLLIYPGTYIENNPLTLRHDTVLRGEGLPITINIVAINTQHPIFILEQQTILEGVHITGASGIGGCGIYVDSSIGFGRAMITRTIVSNCETGYKAVFENNVSHMPPCTMMCLETMVVSTDTTTVQFGYHAADGSMIRCIDTGVTGNLYQLIGIGYYSTGVHPVTGDSSIMRINSGGIQYATVALCCDDGGEVETHANRIEHCTTGCDIGPTGTTSKLGIHGVVFHDISGNEIETVNTDCTIYATGGRIRSDKISLPYPNNIIYDVFHFNSEPSNSSLQVNGILSVGSTMQQSRAFFGCGYSHIFDVTILTNTNMDVGTWDDISVNLLVDDTVSSPMFAGVTVGNTIYFGDNVIFSAMYASMTSPINGGMVYIEYWNGSAWSMVQIMVRANHPPYNSYSNNFFGVTGEIVINFGPMDNWSMKTLNGYNKYWIRFRIMSDISQNPICSRIRIYNDSTSIERDGYVLHYGCSRVRKRHSLTLSDFVVTTGIPTTQDIYLFDDMKVRIPNNRFPNSGTTGIGTIIHIPADIDTSYPITLLHNWVASDNSVGDVVWQLSYGNTRTQIYLSSPPASTATKIKSTAPVASSSEGLIRTEHFDVIVSGITQSDLLFLSIKRLGDDVGDTYASGVVVVSIDIEYVSNCLGKHITNGS
jgi:hypothetical protein